MRKETNANVFLLGKNPIFAPHPNISFNNLDKPEEINKVAWSRRYKNLKQEDTILEHVASETSSYSISKNQIICPSERCVVIIDREMGFVDCSHWTLIGVK